MRWVGKNAIEYAAKLINRLGEIGTRLAAPERHDPRFDPPYSTVQTGVIGGGRALNIVPAECQFDFEVRALPSDDPQQVAEQLRDYAETELLPKMRAVKAEADIRFSELSAYPALATDPQSEVAQLLARLSGSDEFSTVAFGTEGGCSIRRAFRPWCADRGAWIRGTSRMSLSAWSSWRLVMGCWGGWWSG